MKLAIFAYSRRGCDTARRVAACFSAENCIKYTMEKFLQPDFLPICKPSAIFYGGIFGTVDAMVFVSACGIAVRQIAPHVKDKTTDPAVLCVDELGSFVIPLLSGHIGGANDLAVQLADALGAVSVVTTATDINGRFSVDAWAAKNGFGISDMKIAKAVSAAILEQDVPIRTDLPVSGAYPAGTYPGSSGRIGIRIGWETDAPFDETLHLIPRVLHLGIGCRKGTAKEAIAQAAEEVCRENGVDLRAVKCVSSIDLKAQEAGLLEFCRERALPVRFYDAQTLLAVPGEFTPSDFVRQVTGVDNVCERSAMVDAEYLIVKKTARNGVTVAIAAERCEVCFG